MSRKHLVGSTCTGRNVRAGSLCRQGHTLLTELLEWTLYGSVRTSFAWHTAFSSNATNSRGRVSIPIRFDLTVSVSSSVTMLVPRLAYQ